MNVRTASYMLACVGLLGCNGAIGDVPGADGTGTTGRRPGSGSGLVEDPGRVTMRRLNRVEYNNTVRDLLGTTQRPADDFPSDDVGYGYDNIGDVLSTSALHVEMYQRAAEVLVREALAGGGGTAAGASTTQLEAETVGGSAGSASGGAWNLTSTGSVEGSFDASGDGEYRITVRAWQQAAGPEAAQMEVSLDGIAIQTFDVTAGSGAPGEFVAMARTTAGRHTISAAFLNDYYNPTAGEDRNLVVDWLRVEGPLGVAPTSTTATDRLLTCDLASGGETCARQIVGGFAKRAWRRPPTDAEVDRLMQFLDVATAQGDGVAVGLELALQAVLVSPHFLYRVELDPTPDLADPRPLNDWELASRLSYFIWSSMPDEELFAAAEAGLLTSDPEELRRQAMRMIDDPKSIALVENFAGQWLYTRAVPEHEPDYAVFADYDDELAQAFVRETQLLFAEFMREDLPMDEMLTAPFTYVNARLAQHYGLPAPSGTDFVRVDLSSTSRRGILGHGGVLTVTSYPTRTSPVKRGKWVLEQLMCEGPPPPPPGVEGLPDDGGEMVTGTLRDRLEAHRTDPVCASCHQVMDPIGFGLENFDGIGGYRTEDNGSAIDASGELPGLGPFSGTIELANLLAGDPRFTRCAARQMTTYALGRGLEGSADAVWVDAITQQYLAEGGSMRALVAAIVTSEVFTMRGVGGGE